VLREVRRFEGAITLPGSRRMFGEAGDKHRQRVALGNLEAARVALHPDHDR
jgi:hypothetical protein